jgi:hypothetical protein
MAGKLHTYWASYTGAQAKMTATNPAWHRPRAYAEGYNYRRKNGTGTQAANPHPAWQNTDASSNWTAWDRGWQDAEAHVDPTHVGGPAAFT